MPDDNVGHASESTTSSHPDVSYDAFVMMDLDGRVADWSPQAEHLFGWSKDEAGGKLLGSLIVPPQHRDAHWAGLERYRNTGQGRILNQRMQLTAVNRSGREFPVEFTVTPTRIRDQVLFCGVIRPLAEPDLREDRSRQRLVDSRLFQQATSRWWTVDSFEAALQDCVDILCRMTGWPVGHALVIDPRTERLKSADVWYLADTERYAAVREATDRRTFDRGEGLPGRIWAAGETLWSGEGEIGDDPRCRQDLFVDLDLRGVFGFPVVVDGGTVAVLEFFTPEAMAPDPQLLMQVSSLSTQLARTVEKQRWEKERLRLAAIVDSSYDAILSKDADGVIMTWNAGAEHIYGHTAEEAIGQPISLILPEELARISQEEPEIRDSLRAGRRLVQFETYRRHKDGRLIPVAITMTPLRDSQGRIVGSSMIERDMSVRRQRELELQVAKEQAEQANRMKSDFLANISHELRTPMNAIIGMLDLSLAEELDPVLKDYLATARESADTLLYLLNDLLDFSRMEAGRFELEQEPFSLHEVVEGALKTLSVRGHEKGLELAARIDPRAPDALLGDGPRLRQVLINLVSNAIKFTAQGEVSVSVSLDERIAEQATLRFSVRDTGVGIAPQDRERIFHPFTQLDASTTRQQAGAGLGLAICQELIQKMGGALTLESELGQGSTFSFALTFPILDHGHPASPLVPDLTDVPVLVVDDNEASRTIVEETLAGWDMRPTVLADAQRALEEIRQSRQQGAGYELVIVDALMPKVDGFSLIESIQQEGLSDLPAVLMLSPADRQAFKDRCEQLDIAAFLNKPITQSDTLDAIVTALKGSRLDSEAVDRLQEAPRPLEVLLAEDTPANQKVITAILKKRGHMVDIAHNGREAIELHKQNDYDVILMDVQMPMMDGLQATEAIRKLDDHRKAETPIVAMTANARREDRRRCLRAGMTAYIAKPIDSIRLLELVEDHDSKTKDLRRKSITDSVDASTMQALTEPTASLMNQQAALKRLSGNEELLHDLIRYFLEDAPGLLQAAADAVEQRNAEETQRAAHSLRGLAANFEATEVMSAADRLEQIGQAGQLQDAPEALSQLEEAVRNLSTELEAQP